MNFCYLKNEEPKGLFGQLEGVWQDLERAGAKNICVFSDEKRVRLSFYSKNGSDMNRHEKEVMVEDGDAAIQSLIDWARGVIEEVMAQKI